MVKHQKLYEQNQKQNHSFLLRTPDPIKKLEPKATSTSNKMEDEIDTMPLQINNKPRASPIRGFKNTP